jgi:hypothetical protein
MNNKFVPIQHGNEFLYLSMTYPILVLFSIIDAAIQNNSRLNAPPSIAIGELPWGAYFCFPERTDILYLSPPSLKQRTVGGALIGFSLHWTSNPSAVKLNKRVALCRHRLTVNRHYFQNQLKFHWFQSFRVSNNK